MMMSVEQLVEWELAGEAEVLEENLPLCPPQISQLTWDRTRAPAVGSRRLTGWVMARSVFLNRRALATIILGLSLIKKNLPGRDLTKVENHWWE
jgi:hypothetical protein